MSKKRRYPTSAKAGNQASPPPQRKPASRQSIVKLGIAAVLLFFAIQIPLASIKRVHSEMIIKHARGLMQVAPDSRTPAVELRRALHLDPHNADAMSDLAEHLINVEKKKIERGDTHTRSAENLEEASDLLDKSIELLPSARLLRRRGEVNILLADLYDRRGESANATRALVRAYNDLLTAGQYLPQPRREPAAFNASVFSTAFETGNKEVSIDYLHKINRMQQRQFLEAKGLAPNIEKVWLENGLFAHQARELRYRLEKQPTDRRTLQVMARMAHELGLKEVMTNTLEDLAERGLLNEDGEAVLLWLQTGKVPEEEKVEPEAEAAEIDQQEVIP